MNRRMLAAFLVVLFLLPMGFQLNTAASGSAPERAAAVIDRKISGFDTDVENANYRAQIYRTTDGTTVEIGLCNVASMTNLLNRKLALDGYYSVSCRYSPEDVITACGNTMTEVVFCETKEGSRKLCYRYEGPGTDRAASEQRSYALYGTEYSVKDAGIGGRTVLKSVNTLKKLLDAHPEGLYVYMKHGSDKKSDSYGHAILITGYIGDTLYCIDPVNGLTNPEVASLSLPFTDSWEYCTYPKATILYVRYLTPDSELSAGGHIPALGTLTALN